MRLTDADIDELLEIRSELAWLKATIALRRMALFLKAYNPLQPRVPAGNGDESGRWTDGEPMQATSDASRSRWRRMANVISVCITDGGNSTSYDEYGN